MFKRICTKCGNNNQDDFSPKRGNICKTCVKKRAAEYRLSRLEIDKEIRKKLYYKRKAEKAEREASGQAEKVVSGKAYLDKLTNKEDKLFDDLLKRAKGSGRYLESQLSKTRSNHI